MSEVIVWNINNILQNIFFYVPQYLIWFICVVMLYLKFSLPESFSFVHVLKHNSKLFLIIILNLSVLDLPTENIWSFTELSSWTNIEAF